jgi:hypothetical protein
MIPEIVKHGLDVTSVGILISTFLDALPHATAALTFIWVCVRLWETETVRRLTGRWYIK